MPILFAANLVRDFSETYSQQAWKEPSSVLLADAHLPIGPFCCSDHYDDFPQAQICELNWFGMKISHSLFSAPRINFLPTAYVLDLLCLLVFIPTLALAASIYVRSSISLRLYLSAESRCRIKVTSIPTN